MQPETIIEAATDSRRSKGDRRVEELQLPPRENERRHTVERRLPVVDENTASFSDWVRSMVVFLATKRKRAKARSVAKHAKHKR